MNFHIITLFPNSLSSYLEESIIKRAITEKKISVSFYNPRDFVQADKKKSEIKKMGDSGYFKETSLDSKPYGGGPGMVIQALPVLKTLDEVIKKINKKKKTLKTKDTCIVWLTPAGKQFDTKYAKNVSKKYSNIIFICGRYEGVDARVKNAIKKMKEYGKLDEISVGPFVLTGGELPALIMVDCISRQIEGVLGNFDSREEERVSSSDVYTRPEIFEYKSKKYQVPKVLLSGNHKKIEEWKNSKK